MIIFGCTNRQIHFRNGEIHSFDSYPKLDLDFKPQSLDSKNLDWDLVWELQAARGSKPGPRAGLETPIFGFKEPGLRLGLGTSSCNGGSGLQTLNLGFEEKEKGWDLMREPEVLSTQTDRQTSRLLLYIRYIKITICDKHGVYNTISSLEISFRFKKLQMPIYWNCKTFKSFKTP